MFVAIVLINPSIQRCQKSSLSFLNPQRGEVSLFHPRNARAQ